MLFLATLSCDLLPSPFSELTQVSDLAHRRRNASETHDTNLEERPIVVACWSTSDVAPHPQCQAQPFRRQQHHTHTPSHPGTLTNAHTHEHETLYTRAGNDDISPVGSGRYAVRNKRTSPASGEAISASSQATSPLFQAPPPGMVIQRQSGTDTG